MSNHYKTRFYFLKIRCFYIVLNIQFFFSSSFVDPWPLNSQYICLMFYSLKKKIHLIETYVSVFEVEGLISEQSARAFFKGDIRSVVVNYHPLDSVSTLVVITIRTVVDTSKGLLIPVVCRGHKTKRFFTIFIFFFLLQFLFTCRIIINNVVHVLFFFIRLLINSIFRVPLKCYHLWRTCRNFTLTTCKLCKTFQTRKSIKSFFDD